MLLDLQRAFRATVSGDEDVIASDACVARGGVARRLAVYRNNVQKSLTDVLEAAFPVVLRVVGARFFYAMARDYVITHPPRVPQLSLYGASFADFIAIYPRAQSLPYLADVARLEWARGESYFAADAPMFDPAQLSRIAPEHIGAAMLTVHPATRLVRSAFPIHRIWTVNQPQAGDVPAVDMSIAESVMIVRPKYEVTLRPMSPGDAAFVAACAAGQNLNDATVAALNEEAGFDLQAALHQHFLGGTFTSVHGK